MLRARKYNKYEIAVLIPFEVNRRINSAGQNLSDENEIYMHVIHDIKRQPEILDEIQAAYKASIRLSSAADDHSQAIAGLTAVEAEVAQALAGLQDLSDPETLSTDFSKDHESYESDFDDDDLDVIVEDDDSR